MCHVSLEQRSLKSLHHRNSGTAALVVNSESIWLISPHLLEVIDWSALCYAVARVIWVVARWFLAGFYLFLFFF